MVSTEPLGFGGRGGPLTFYFVGTPLLVALSKILLHQFFSIFAQVRNDPPIPPLAQFDSLPVKDVSYSRKNLSKSYHVCYKNSILPD